MKTPTIYILETPTGGKPGKSEWRVGYVPDINEIFYPDNGDLTIAVDGNDTKLIKWFGESEVHEQLESAELESYNLYDKLVRDIPELMEGGVQDLFVGRTFPKKDDNARKAEKTEKTEKRPEAQIG